MSSIIRRLSEPDDKPFHSSGYAREARGKRMGSMTPQTFRQRYQIERNRRAVERYRDSMVAHQHDARLQYHNTDIIRPSQNSDTRPANHPASRDKRPAEQTPPPQPRFHEPPRRDYFPYQ